MCRPAEDYLLAEELELFPTSMLVAPDNSII